MAITIKSRKQKSRSLQNHVAEKIRESFPKLTINDVKPSIMGESGIDIKLSESARKIFPYGIECKNQEKISIWGAIDQCESNSQAENLTPILIFKRNRTEPYAVIKLSEFLKLVKKAENHK